MKILLNIIRFIAIIVLSVSIICCIVFNITVSTFLSKEYVLNKLNETDFYSKTYEEIQSNFENYIYQSGLDENVIDGICTTQKVQDDINIIICNIYDRKNEKVDTTVISDNLNKKIDELGIKNTKNSNAINQFIKTITSEYENTILHTNYENTISSYLTKVNKIVDIGNKISIILIVISIFILLLTSIKEITHFINCLGISLVVSGTFIEIALSILTKNIKIENIKLLNEAFSYSFTIILQEIVVNLLKVGIVLIPAGIILIVIYGIMNGKQKN